MTLFKICRMMRVVRMPVRASARLTLAAFCLTGLFGPMASAASPSIEIYSNSGGNNTLPSPIPFTILNLGTNKTANTLVQSTTVTSSSSGSAPAKLPSGAEISSIAFGTGGSTPSGVFAGGVGGQAATPFGSTNTKTDYLVAGASGSVTVSYTVTQDALQMLWGSVDSSATNNNNVIIFKNGGTTIATVNGADIASAMGSGSVSGTTNVALRFFGLSGFDTVVFSDPGSAAFEFALGLPVPEPATIGLFGIAAAGLGVARVRGKPRRARSAK